MSDTKNTSPFTITIFMADGQTDGVKVVKRDNWDGVGIICPRGRYSVAKKNRDEFNRSGVYILIGDKNDEDEIAQPKIYIGETDFLSNRLTQHAGKDFWRQVVLFTKQSDSTPLNKGHIKYLEYQLLKKANASKRCEMENKTNPDRLPSISEEDEAAANTYLNEMLSLLSVIDIRFFESAPSPQGRKIYLCKGAKGYWDASGYETNNRRFVVQEGSIANEKTTPSFEKSYSKKSRKQLIEKEILVKKEKQKGYFFTQDYEFRSPSRAGSVVRGHDVNGLTEWKDNKGVTLKDNQDNEDSIREEKNE